MRIIYSVEHRAGFATNFETPLHKKKRQRFKLTARKV